jgi:hypothetical protein
MCVILYTEINGKKILVKNRDRAYKPKVKIIHEIVNGIEVAYLKDESTGWIEGMNANGTGILNSTLSSHDSKEPSKKLKKKGNVIYNSLINNKSNRNFYDIINNAQKDYILEGHTLLCHDNDIYHIENTLKNNFVAERIDKPSVYSNYGIRIKDAGYTKCIKGLSTFLRADITRNQLRKNKIKSEDDLINLLNTNYINIDPRFHPYRDKHYTIKKVRGLDPKKVKISTTGQILLNMTDKEFMYYTDVNQSKKIEYINKLPRDYLPNIRIIIKETEKNLKNKRKVFTRKYLRKVYKKFECKDTRRFLKKRNKNYTRRRK